MRKSNVLLCGLLIVAIVIALAPVNLQAATYYWDTATTSGYQPGNGTWGTSAYWTTNGTTLVTWPAGTHDAHLRAVGNSIITLNGNSAVICAIYNADAVNDSAWELTGGSLTLSSRIKIYTTNAARTTTVTFSSGTITTPYFVMGESSGYLGTNVFDMTGGDVNITSASAGIVIGTQAGKSYLNLSGGTFFDQSSSATNSLVGSRGGANYTNAYGELNISGTGVLKIANADKALQIGRNDVSTTYTATGVLNLETGGTLWTSRSITQTLGQADKTFGTFNFDGGTLKALDGNQSNWIGHSNPNFNAYVKAGGALIDTSGYDMTITQALLTDKGASNGGLTKLGDGTLILSGLNTYTGDTKVDVGTLSLAQAYLADASAMWIADGAYLNLSHGQADTIAALYLGGVAQDPGTYHAGNCSHITGSGSLVIVPEPSTLALLAAGLVGLLVYVWRKRK